jgi:hypothetical protein
MADMVLSQDAPIIRAAGLLINNGYSYRRDEKSFVFYWVKSVISYGDIIFFTKFVN